ncbi:MAG: ABC transporter ATP-binding protein [Geobacteraceae bacterium]|nr:ABC transporter ATP-binding protein [Geobacteraceae bacterium]
MAEMLETRELRMVYQDGKQEVVAVAGVDVRFRRGEIVGLFGPSGSGKTTLLSLLGCILKPSSGSLRLFGKEVTSLGEKALPAVRKRFISFIFQGFNLFPALSVLDNVLLGLRIKGITGEEAEQRALRVLEEVGLSERSTFLPRDLSGGQKQRVAVARALASDCPLILADEPTGNLDHANGRNVMEILRTLAHEKGRCVVVATHDNRIDDIFDRILFMEDGSITKETDDINKLRLMRELTTSSLR